MTTSLRVAAGVPSGGQFAPDSRCEAHVTLLDAHGRGVHVTPGVVDDAARYAYMNGQCLAFAAALTERGMTPVLVLAGGGLDWERDTTSFEPRDTHLFVHALASDGVDVHDITGAHDPAHLLEAMRDAHGTAVIVHLDPAELAAIMERPDVQAQDLATARTMVDALHGRAPHMYVA